MDREEKRGCDLFTLRRSFRVSRAFPRSLLSLRSALKRGERRRKAGDHPALMLANRHVICATAAAPSPTKEGREEKGKRKGGKSEDTLALVCKVISGHPGLRETLVVQSE